MEVKSWKQCITEYWASAKGKSLAMSVNMAYVLITMVVGLALQLCAILDVASISQSDVKILFTVQFVLSSLSLAIILLLGSFNKLTKNDQGKDQSATSFLRAGMIGLGTGSMVYFVVALVQVVVIVEECQYPLEFIWNSAGILFIFLQTAFLVKHSRLKVDKSMPVGHLALFLMAQILATNAGLWITIIGMEADAESHHLDELEEDTTYSLYSAPSLNSTNGTLPIKCINRTPLQDIILPYTFPMLIEYCVVSASMAMVIWENCGHVKQEKNSQEGSASTSTQEEGEDDSGLNMSPSSGDISASFSDAVSEAYSPSFYEIHQAQGHDKYGGAIVGWLVLCGTLGMTVTGTYFLYTEEHDFDTTVPYGLNITLTGLFMIVAAYTFTGLSKLTFFDEELRESAINQKGIEFIKSQYNCEVKHKMDQRLSTLTLLSLVALKLFSAIAAFDVNDYVILADSVLSLVFAVGQNLFLAYADNKRIKTHDQFKEKPGRSGLEFLRIVNFALWINNTFLLKNPITKEAMNTSFGVMEWAVLSNIFQPLAILYYFHAMITIAEVIYHVYTSKYVGVIRRSKQRKSDANRFISGPENMAFDITDM